jgi:glutathione S-transferase
VIYHLALADEWHAAQVAGEYRRSTLGKSLDEVGFIHCSHADQVRMIADLVYGDRTDVVLLTIDPHRVGAEIRVENLDGGDQLFPHIYGPLPLNAVISAEPYAAP